jgi:hypothetical protein
MRLATCSAYQRGVQAAKDSSITGSGLTQKSASGLRNRDPHSARIWRSLSVTGDYWICTCRFTRIDRLPTFRRIRSNGKLE